MKNLPSTDPRSWSGLVEAHHKHGPHGNWYFLPWHRAFLLAVEAIGAELLGDSNFALPYWDWTEFRQLPREMVAANVGGSPNSLFHAGRTMTGNATLSEVLAPFGVDAENIFGRGAVDAILASGSFQLFGSLKPAEQNNIDESWQRSRGSKSKLEREPHDYGHGAVGGDMGNPAVSPNDPIFYMHHGNVDRIWAKWNANGNANDPSPLWRDFVFRANLPTADGSPNPDVTVSQLEDVSALGYLYDDALQPGADTNSIRVGGETGIEFLASTNAGVNSVAEIARATSLFLSTEPALAERVEDVVRASAPQNRVIAFVKDVETPKERDLNVRVYVNCDYLSPLTRADDPHYAGAFTFFVYPDHDGGHGHDKQSFAIDLTDAIRKITPGDGSADREIEVQLMPLTYDGRTLDENSFKVGDVEIAVI